MVDRDLVSIVWGETSPLAPKDGSDLARLRAVVATLALAAKGARLDGGLCRAAAPRADDATALEKYKATETVASAAEGGTLQSETPLPKRAVLWEVTASGFPRRDTPLPPSIAWITEAAATLGGDFVAGEGSGQRTYRLYESTTAPAANELPYVSGLTGSGIPAAAAARRWYKNVNWWVGLGGAAMFFIAMLSILWTAVSFSQAYDLLVGRQPAEIREFAETLKLPACPDKTNVCFLPAAALTETADKNKQKAGEARSAAVTQRELELRTIGPTCAQRLVQWGGSKVPRALADRDADLACLDVVGQAVDFASRRLVIRADGWAGAAMQAAGTWLFGWHVPRPVAPTVSLGVPLILMMIGVVVVLVGLGRGVSGKPLGALMTPEGRYSLALAQVTFWSVLVLTSLAAITMLNVGLISEQMRLLDARTAQELSVFPTIPNEIWLVLGITFASPVLSTVIKGVKSTGNTGSNVSFANLGSSARGDARNGSIADWFLGEEGPNQDRIDISRVQMVLVTASLIVAYGNEIFAFTRDLSPAGIFTAVATPSVLIASLPAVGTAMAALLAMSHATYLVSKAADKPAPGQPVS